MQKSIFSLIAAAFLTALFVGGVVLLAGWVVGWNTPAQFSDGFFISGAVLIVLGVLGVMGNYKMRSDFGVLYSQSAGDMNLSRRAQRWAADTVQSYGATVFLTLSGVFLIGFAVLAGWMK